MDNYTAVCRHPMTDTRCAWQPASALTWRWIGDGFWGLRENPREIMVEAIEYWLDELECEESLELAELDFGFDNGYRV